MAEDIEKKENEVEGQAVPEAPAAPADVPEVLPEGVESRDLTDKDLALLANLTDLDGRMKDAVYALFKGFLKVLEDQSRVESEKTKAAAFLKEKHEIPDNAVWQADVMRRKLFFRVQEAPTTPPQPGQAV